MNGHIGIEYILKAQHTQGRGVHVGGALNTCALTRVATTKAALRDDTEICEGKNIDSGDREHKETVAGKVTPSRL